MEGSPRPHEVTEVGATFGVEEEFHLVEGDTCELIQDPELHRSVLCGSAGGHVHDEFAISQVEVSSVVCSSIEDLRVDLRRGRAEAREAANQVGATIMAASTHPFASWVDQKITDRPHYRCLVERWAGLAIQQNVCGLHVHVGVPDLETAVAVMDRARPYLPVLLAMTGSSPFHEGRDTGYESFRTMWTARWPTAGPSEPLHTAATYRGVVDELARAGVITDAQEIYWDVRPSARYPTLEFRLGDSCTDVDDVLLHAAVVRSLCRVLGARFLHDHPVVHLRPELLRAARWRAARYGLSEPLFDVSSGQLVDPRELVEALLAELREDLERHQEWDVVRGLTSKLLSRGTSAHRQRSWMRAGASTRDVARRLVDLTA